MGAIGYRVVHYKAIAGLALSCIIFAVPYDITTILTIPFLCHDFSCAGAVFDGNTVLEHKVLRRYTVRAKAGGGQSSHDNKSGKAQSAGAMMRRYVIGL